MKIISLLFMLVATAILFYNGYEAVFKTDKKIQKDLKTRGISPNNSFFLYNWSQKNKFGVKIIGYFFILMGLLFLIFTIVYILKLFGKS